MSSLGIRVAICGGGISGLCLAVALSKYTHIECQVYEAAGRFREIGAGVMIWTRTWRVLELLGLSDDFMKIAHPRPDGSLGVGFDYRRSDMPTDGFQFHTVNVPDGCIRFHRAEFLDTLVNHLPEKTAHFGKKLVSYKKTGDGIELLFADGSSAVCDLLVGCDGIKSVVRKHLLEDLIRSGRGELSKSIEPTWSGTIAYRGLIPVDKLLLSTNGHPHRTIDTPMMYCGHNKHVVGYSISQGSIVNVITFSSQPDKEGSIYEGEWMVDCSQDELLACYAGWEPEVVDLLKHIDKPTKWALHQLHPLPQYVHESVALVGDAAHAMLPHQGAGAGQAIEDAYVLSVILGSSLLTKDNLSLALKAYESVRLPMANHVLTGSRQSGMMYEFNGPNGEDYESLGPAIQRQWNWVWETQPDDEAGRGLRWFEEQLQK